MPLSQCFALVNGITNFAFTISGEGEKNYEVEFSLQVPPSTRINQNDEK